MSKSTCQSVPNHGERTVQPRNSPNAERQLFQNCPSAYQLCIDTTTKQINDCILEINKGALCVIKSLTTAAIMIIIVITKSLEYKPAESVKNKYQSLFKNK